MSYANLALNVIHGCVVFQSPIMFLCAYVRHTILFLREQLYVYIGYNNTCAHDDVYYSCVRIFIRKLVIDGPDIRNNFHLSWCSDFEECYDII